LKVGKQNKNHIFIRILIEQKAPSLSMTFCSLQAMDSTRFLKYSLIAILVVHSSVMFPFPVHHVGGFGVAQLPLHPRPHVPDGVKVRGTAGLLYELDVGPVIEPLGHIMSLQHGAPS
jgi:hypothetical protein